MNEMRKLIEAVERAQRSGPVGEDPSFSSSHSLADMMNGLGIKRIDDGNRHGSNTFIFVGTPGKEYSDEQAQELFNEEIYIDDVDSDGTHVVEAMSNPRSSDPLTIKMERLGINSIESSGGSLFTVDVYRQFAKSFDEGDKEQLEQFGEQVLGARVMVVAYEDKGYTIELGFKVG